MERLIFKSIDNSGKEITLEAVVTYHDDNTNKDYIVYTDGTIDENNNLRIYYSLYKMIDDNIQLIEIKNIEDKKIGLELIQELVGDIGN